MIQFIQSIYNDIQKYMNYRLEMNVVQNQDLNSADKKITY